MCEICLKLTIKTPERSRRRSGVFFVDFEQVNTSWVKTPESLLSHTTPIGLFLLMFPGILSQLQHHLYRDVS